MAMTRYRRGGSRRYLRGVGKRTRRSRWIVVVGENISVSPGTYQVIDLLTPVQPAGTIADLIYQQMTKPTLIALMGHMTLTVTNPFTTTGTTLPFGCEYAWGIYRDVDFTSSATALPAYSAGYSNSWMVHKTGSLSTAGIYAQDTATQAYSVTPGNTDISYRRYELNLRKYKRTLDSFNDTLVLSVENGTSASASAATFVFSFYFRMLLLE